VEEEQKESPIKEETTKHAIVHRVKHKKKLADEAKVTLLVKE
jgi:hypothetical protein